MGNILTLPKTGERYWGDGIWRTKSELEHRHRYMVAQCLVEGKTVLDAACGTGYGSALFAENAQSVVGIDIAPDAVEFCEQNYQAENLHFQTMSVCNMQFPDEQFDIVVSFETFEHLHAEDQVIFLREIKRVLKENGILMISAPNVKVLRDVVEWEHVNPYHLHEMEVPSMEHLLKRFFDKVELYSQCITQTSLIVGETQKPERLEAFYSKSFQLFGEPEYVIFICGKEKICPEIPASTYIPFINQYYAEEYLPFTKSYLYRDLGKGYTEEDKTESQFCEFSRGRFKIRFLLDDVKNGEIVRFDPFENTGAIFELTAHSSFGLQKIESNESFSEDGWDIFLHRDPIYLYQVAGIGKGYVEFEGCYRSGTNQDILEYENRWKKKLEACQEKETALEEKIESLKHELRGVQRNGTNPENLIRNLKEQQNLCLEQYQRANEYLHQRNLLEDEVAELKRANDLLQQTCRMHKKDIQIITSAYQSSTSWKLTAPLRAISALFKHLFGPKNV